MIIMQLAEVKLIPCTEKNKRNKKLFGETQSKKKIKSEPGLFLSKNFWIW